MLRDQLHAAMVVFVSFSILVLTAPVVISAAAPDQIHTRKNLVALAVMPVMPPMPFGKSAAMSV